MAKGNMLLGYSRGSVGDVTFTKIKGQQVAKARNRNPHNPRTDKQCIQRGRFAAAVKFFTRGNQAYYKFAFENKSQVESDYNAFMRENVKRAPAISKAAFDNYDYPVIAPFIMSKGSIVPMDLRCVNDEFRLYIHLAAPETAPTTIGNLSNLLLNKSEFEVGDIITFVYISSLYVPQTPSVEAQGSGKPSWAIRQFIIDPTSTDTITSVTGMYYDTVDDMAVLKKGPGEDPLTGDMDAMVIVHSRNTAQGLKVSTQELILDEDATSFYETSLVNAYNEAVAAAWKTAGAIDTKPDAILQGSIAYEG